VKGEVGFNITVTITCDGPDGSHAEDSITVKQDPPYPFDISIPK
jgi:hypothetical protein